MKTSNIYFTEKNYRGAWVIYGNIGIRQYYDYTKAQAKKLYNDECNKTIFINQSK